MLQTGSGDVVWNRDQSFFTELTFKTGDPPLKITSCEIAEEYQIRLLELDRESGTIRIAAELGERWLTGGGVIQGGIVAGILDFAMAFAVLARLGPDQALATTNLDVAYLRPSHPGHFEATAEVISLGRSVAFLKAELFGPNGKCTATATSTGMVITKE